MPGPQWPPAKARRRGRAARLIVVTGDRSSQPTESIERRRGGEEAGRDEQKCGAGSLSGRAIQFRQVEGADFAGRNRRSLSAW